MKNFYSQVDDLKLHYEKNISDMDRNSVNNSKRKAVRIQPNESKRKCSGSLPIIWGDDSTSKETDLKRKLENSLTSNQNHPSSMDEAAPREEFDDSTLEELNAVKLKKALRLKDMLLCCEYKILDAKRVNTKFGKRILLQLEDNALFLPQRYERLSDAVIEAMKTGKYSVRNNGECGATYDLCFQQHNDDQDEDVESVTDENDDPAQMCDVNEDSSNLQTQFPSVADVNYYLKNGNKFI